MKCYLLLRDNRQSGPYSLEELSGMKLKPFDLLWQEGASTSWSYPEEMDELASLVDHYAPGPKETVPIPKGIFVSLPNQRPAAAPESRPSPQEPKEPIPSFAPSPVEEIEEESEVKEPEVIASFQENYREPRNRELWKRNFLPAGQVFSVALIFIGAVLGAFVIKKIVDSFDQAPLADSTSAAVAISAPELPRDNDPNYRNAITREVVPAVDSVEKAPPKTEKPKDIRKLVHVKGTDYKVGLLGGIKDLELTVHNGSNHLVEQVVIVVEYLKPKGEVVHTEHYTVQDIKPFKSKVIPIPSSDRGVKVKYRILNISSKQYKRLLDQV
ncbi:MAG TPA: hypothetical protein VGB46_08615 [Flavisolibacter sp.]